VTTPYEETTPTLHSRACHRFDVNALKRIILFTHQQSPFFLRRGGRTVAIVCVSLRECDQFTIVAALDGRSKTKFHRSP